MSQPWMPLYVGDYFKKTRHLSAAEHGAYLLLIMSYWETGFLPSDDGQIMRLTAMTEKEWKTSRNTIAAFFDQGWRHPRIDEELDEARVKHERRAEAGRKGGQAKPGLSNASISERAKPKPGLSNVASPAQATYAGDAGGYSSSISQVDTVPGEAQDLKGSRTVTERDGHALTAIVGGIR